MLPERRDAEWRPVATARVPAHCLGLLAGSAAGLAGCLLVHDANYGVYAGAAALGAFVSNRIAARRLARLRDEGGGHQFAATLRLSREGVYGHDEGLVAFEDGYLVYMGRRCAFSLGAADVNEVKIEGGKLEFAFPGPAGRHKVELHTPRHRPFLAAAARWKGQAARSDTPVLPPARPDPNLPVPLVVGAETLPLLAVALAAWATAPGGALGLVILLALAVLIPLYAAHQFAALRRLARGEPPRPPLLGRGRRRRGRAPTALPPPSG